MSSLHFHNPRTTNSCVFEVEYTVWGSLSGWAFSDDTNSPASRCAFMDLDDSLGWGGSVVQQTSPTTWTLHLDDALSYLVDDNDSDVLIQVRLAPVSSIAFAPQTQTAEAGSAADLRVQASGLLPLLCLWYFNNTNLISCSTNCGLALTGVQFSQSGTYTVVISNALGAITSAPAMLQVIAPVQRRSVPGVKVTGEAEGQLNLDYANSVTASTLWTALGSFSLTSTSQYYFDLTLPPPVQRFYRGWQTGTPGLMPSLDLHLVPAITLTGNIGGSVRVDCINQFGPTDAWATLDTVTLTNTSQLYFDTSAWRQPQRLYRVVQLP